MEPGNYEVWKESSTAAIAIPLIGRVLFLFQKSRLLLFIQRGNKCWCLSHPLKSLLISTFITTAGSLLNSLHVAGFPLLVLKAWDDNSDTLQNCRGMP